MIRVQRTYVLNDEAALVVCDYGTGKRPEVPFPYFAEAWTGLEYQAAATMIYAGMVREGVEVFDNSRAPLRWRAPQSMGRSRMRPPLRARHVGLVRRAGAQRLPLPWRGEDRVPHAPPQRTKILLFLVGRAGLGNLYARRR